MTLKTPYKIGITVTLLGLAAVLLMSGNGSAYKMVDEVAAEPEKWDGKNLRIHGWVGSIQKTAQTDKPTTAQESVTQFVLEKAGKRIHVTHIGIVPDAFGPNAEVVAEGRFSARDGELKFTSHKIQAKCPSKYEGARENSGVF